MELALLYIGLAAAFGLFMAWGIGANDVANAMAPSVGSRAITIWQAILIAAMFEFAGAVLAGGGVTSTIRKGIVDASLLHDQPELLILGMLASLLAAGTWLLVASARGWPVSTTHTIIGAVVGFAAIGIGVSAVQWDQVGRIVMSWVVSPVLAGVIAWLLFTSVRRLVLERADPLLAARRYVPAYIFLVGFFMTLVTVFKGLKHIGIELTVGESYLLATSIGALIAIVGAVVIIRIPAVDLRDTDFHFYTVERIFGVLMVVTACSMAFAHGSNDVANAIGPVAAVVSIALNGSVEQSAIVPVWILVLGGVGIVLGLATYGHRVIATVGNNITDLTPSRGFAAGLAAAATIVVASGTGLPISTTHTVVGAILGVGMARGIAAINLKTVGSIFMSWIVTIPAGALLSVAFFALLRILF
ncbi:MAG: inorganic phosphate transporter [Pseudomonadota bacterium]|nr:MAG: inorganic phosphate transporter [Pseudomonadota bacterium]